MCSNVCLYQFVYLRLQDGRPLAGRLFYCVPSSGDGGKRSANLATGSPAARPLAKVVWVSLNYYTKNLAARLFTRRWTGLLPLPPAPLRGERAASNLARGAPVMGAALETDR